MSYINTGDKVRAYLEYPDGSIFEMNCITTQVSFQIEPMVHFYKNEPFIDQGPIRTTIELEGISPGLLSRNDFSKKLHTSKEWMCAYCGRPNKREQETCCSCGAVRSFVYGD